MEISNIINTGTSLKPIINATIDGIDFTNIPAGSKGTKGSTFWNSSSNADVWKDNGDGTKWKPSINGVDINWNDAELSGAICGVAQDISEDLTISTISSTGDLIKVLAEQQAQIKALSALVKALYVSIVGEGN